MAPLIFYLIIFKVRLQSCQADLKNRIQHAFIDLPEQLADFFLHQVPGFFYGDQIIKEELGKDGITIIQALAVKML